LADPSGHSRQASHSTIVARLDDLFAARVVTPPDEIVQEARRS
jgi:hypothetical protein